MSRLSLSLTRQLPRRHIRLSPLSAHLARRCPRVLFYTLLLTHLRLCQFRMCLRYATRHPLCSDRTSRVDLVRSTLLVVNGQGHLKAQAQKAA